MMKNYVFNELKGKEQGEMIIIKAATADEACEKAKIKEKIKPYERFKTMYFGKTYQLYELGKPFAVDYICHR